MKKLTALFLSLMMALGCVCGGAAFADEAASPTPAPFPTPSAETSAQIPEGSDEQIKLLYSKFDSLKQSDSSTRWSYTVTDLDHDGLIELLAGTIQGSGRFTTVKGWRVKADKKDVEELTVKIPEGGSFPDIITDAADTYRDPDTGYWYYMFNDQVTVSTREVYANKSAIALIQTELQYYTYAFQHNEWLDGRMVTTFTDRSSQIITPEEYNSVGSAVFGHMESSTTRFDWFLASDANGAGRFADSYAVFLGLRQPVNSDVPAPVMTPRPDTYSAFLLITKNPTDEYHTEGETAWFIANAENWSTATWTFVDPYRNECSWQSFNNRFPGSSVSGGDSASVSISNVQAGMSGWGAYCTFYGNGQTARTTTAWFSVDARQPYYGQMDGYVTDAMMSTVTIALDNGSSVQLLKDICQIDGSLDIGSSATVYYHDYPSRENIYSCVIRGGSQPSYGQMDGYVADYLMSTVTIALDNGDTVQLLKDICQIDGSLGYGCAATVYYRDYPSADNIYSCYIQGSYDPPDPGYGQMSATFAGATMSGSSFQLEDGSFVTVPFSICSSYGNVTYGDPATVYYSGGYPSSDNIYHVDVYGTAGDQEAPDDFSIDQPVLYDPWANVPTNDWDIPDGGGWAGMNNRDIGEVIVY